MNVIDNEDDTVTVVGQFSTGQVALDAMVRFEALNTGEILYKKRLPESGELDVKIPTQAYQIVLDGGPGHTIVKDGIAPIKGYTINKNIQKKGDKEKSTLSQNMTTKDIWSWAYIVLISITFLLIALTIYYSKRNTDKILRMIENTK